MKAICRNCHFLAKEYRDTNGPLTFSLSDTERKTAQSTPENTVQPHYSLKCHMGVWDEGVSTPSEGRDLTLNKVIRNNSCFFFPHQPAMLFKAAHELQKRREENRQMKRSNLYTRAGLWVASGALALSALIELIKYYGYGQP
jgi:hypothetical protein